MVSGVRCAKTDAAIVMKGLVTKAMGIVLAVKVDGRPHNVHVSIIVFLKKRDIYLQCFVSKQHNENTSRNLGLHNDIRIVINKMNRWQTTIQLTFFCVNPISIFKTSSTLLYYF